MSQSVISVVAIAAAMASAGGCRREAQVPAWKIEGIPAVAYASKTPLSAARWIWAGPRCTKQQAVCFRHRFEMPQAEAISLQIRADDIIDGIYLNGETISVRHGQVSSEDLSKSVRKGENPFKLDSKEPDWTKFQDFLKGEVRFASLYKLFPDRAEELLQKTEEFAKVRLNTYKRLAAQQ